MRYIALEEAFAIPELAARQPATPMRIRVTGEYAELCGRRLPDFEEYRLPDMDAHGVEIQVLSLTVPGIQADTDARKAVDNAAFANDFLAEAVARHPSRFRGFAALPMQDPAAAVAELERCVRDLGFVGALVNDHTQGRYLDDPAYEQVWSALEELGVPLYLHPGSVPADDWHVMRGRPEMYGASWSWQAETGGHAMRLVYAGVFDRHPRATLILGHLGEFLPFQRSRLDSRYRTLRVDAPLNRMPSEYIGTNILLTTSGVLAPEAVEAAVLTAGADAVMFSVDYPYEDTAAAVASVEKANLSDEVKEKVAHGNARRVLGL
ncbi:amidohydrolase [Sphaerisporangium krabiense]|uniref:2,3-dihydroxybenzoate decarboxylase n=1 Tax=Sphaerisporangium krabiense TaxID=763782 RepID=A0A7W8ZCU6_9ACTN|nr:amidohydrolase family protein [Sphaerisporangium krabiense]MBB5631550.1 2,3-dihydroxybenzoate decarboxylase [Sphaerisporangium krabiense]GII60964.1 amidohydrolase [Sphaerisporangium krabiense]